jgi:hypothetical protein
MNAVYTFATALSLMLAAFHWTAGREWSAISILVIWLILSGFYLEIRQLRA